MKGKCLTIGATMFLALSILFAAGITVFAFEHNPDFKNKTSSTPDNVEVVLDGLYDVTNTFDGWLSGIHFNTVQTTKDVASNETTISWSVPTGGSDTTIDPGDTVHVGWSTKQGNSRIKRWNWTKGVSYVDGGELPGTGSQFRTVAAGDSFFDIFNDLEVPVTIQNVQFTVVNDPILLENLNARDLVDQLEARETALTPLDVSPTMMISPGEGISIPLPALLGPGLYGIATWETTFTGDPANIVTSYVQGLAVTGEDQIGVFRPSSQMWYLDYNGNGDWDPGIDGALGSFGDPTDLPIAGDWDGDGYDEIGVFRPSDQKWYVDYNGNGAWDGVGVSADDIFGPFGDPDDLPIAGDWNNDGVDEIGVFRPSTQMWYLDYDNNGDWDVLTDTTYGPFGDPEDLPIAGDWDNDGVDEIGVFRPSVSHFYLDYDGDGGWGAADKAYGFGDPEDLPIAGDWNNDGVDEIGVFRPSTQMWYLDYNGNGDWDPGIDGALGSFGDSTDLPIAGHWQDGGLSSPLSVKAAELGSGYQALCFPNPASVGGEVTFQVMGAGVNAVQVSIYDLGGGLVYQSELVSGQSVTWDLRFEEGTPVANGIYLYAVSAKVGEKLIKTEVGKLLILR